VRISSDAVDVILSGTFPREDLIQPIRHPEPSLFEGVRISSFINFLSFLRTTIKNIKAHPPPENGTVRTRRGIVELFPH
jgi:hypothetical protein